jgi:hypothetical protein
VIFPFKKSMVRIEVSPFLKLLAIAFVVSAAPCSVGAQSLFDWPIRADLAPEAVLPGSGAIFWNPAGIASLPSLQEVWVMHIDGPDATGVSGVAAGGIVDLPLGVRGGVGYWHLGIQDIPRTTTSPEQQDGSISVGEDGAVLSAGRVFWNGTGIGAGLRVSRGEVGREARSDAEGLLGVYQRVEALPLDPRVGLAVHGLGRKAKAIGGLELTLPALAAGRIPIRIGYGLQVNGDERSREHRLSFRVSWMEQVHGGFGLNGFGNGDGWTPMWLLGADVGRYSFSVLRESLANGFGAIHFFRAALRFP